MRARALRTTEEREREREREKNFRGATATPSSPLANRRRSVPLSYVSADGERDILFCDEIREEKNSKKRLFFGLFFRVLNPIF